MKTTILNMIDNLDARQKSVIRFALMGMTGDVNTTAEMVEQLDDRELRCLLHTLEGMQ